MKSDPACFTLSVGDGANDVNMIQSASIGVGVMGKEGNQAAAFSDYAIPSFKGLRRLIFWHGRKFGNRSIPYLGINIFKSAIYMTPNLWNNMINGFSGLASAVSLYHALYNVMNTTFPTTFQLVHDQDVSFNKEQYVHDAPEIKK